MVNSKNKICFLVSSLANEGPVNVIYNILSYIDFSLFEVSIVTLVQEGENSRIEDFSKLPIVIYQIAKLNIITNPWQLFKALKKQLNIIKPDLLHSHCPRSLFLMNFLPSRYIKTYTVHIYPGLQQKILYGNTFGKIVIGLSKLFIKRIDATVGCAENVKEQFWTNDRIKIDAIPNGGAFNVQTVSKEQKELAKMELGLNKDLKYFIFVGRFSKEKNPEFLFNAFLDIKRSDISLIMLGSGDLYNTLKEKANDKIILPGFISDIRKYLIVADYYLSASYVEGLPNTLLESMALGLPYLLSDIPPHLEVHNKSGKYKGEIFKNDDALEFNQKLDALLSVDRSKASENVQELYIEEYTSEIMSKKYQTFYTMQITKRNN